MQERFEPASQWTFARRLALFTCYTLLLFASYYFNVFKVAGPIRTSHIGYDSYLVLNRLHLAEHGGGAFLPMVAAAAPADPNNTAQEKFTYYYYTSQLGLQAMVLSAVMKLTPLAAIDFAFAASAAFCLATAAVLALFFVSVACRLGAVTGHLAAFAAALSPIVAEFSTSIYWTTFLLFAPFVSTWILYPAWSTTRRGRLGLAALVFLLVGLKSACGYEFLTCVTLSPLVAVLFHHLWTGSLGWRQLLTCGQLFAAGCGGFLAALGMHAWQLKSSLGIDGLNVVKERAANRTFVGDPTQEAKIDFLGRFSFLPDTIEYPVNCFWQYFYLPSVELPLGGEYVPFWAPTLFCLGLAVYAIVRRRQTTPLLRALAVGGGAALVSSLSWQVLVVNHMCVHFHLNQIVFWLPLMLVVAVTAAWLIQQTALRWNFARPLETLLGPACLLLVAANVQWHLAHQIARNTRQQNHLARVSSLLDQPPAQWASPDIIGYIDSVVEQPGAGHVPIELARSSLMRFSGQPQRQLVISGWVTDTASDGRTPKIVVVQGDQVLTEHETTFIERPDVEGFLKRSAPNAGFTTKVALPPESNQPVRVFVLSGPDFARSAELGHPWLADSASRTKLR